MRYNESTFYWSYYILISAGIQIKKLNRTCMKKNSHCLFHIFNNIFKQITKFVHCLFQGLKKVKAHGLGVHTPEEIEQFGKKDLQALSEMLGDKVVNKYI